MPTAHRPEPLGSTYRLQLHRVGFGGARRAVGYLARLGVETLYLSPVLQAAPGSTHGYDVADVTRLDPAYGTPDDFEALLESLAAHRMRVLLDIVPNHMAADAANPWWWDVLARGPGSAHAGVFDIDWAAQGGKVLLPVLGRPVAEVLAGGELTVVSEDGEDRLAYFDRRFPLTGAEGGGGGPPLAEMLGAQHYRLAYWRLGRRQGNYRRFFDVDGLVGVRVEDPAVYEETHRLVRALADDRRVAGLRVDHIDGLADPAGYLARLRSDLTRRPPPVVVVEKILASDEMMPAHWEVDGTTGYEFAHLSGGLLVDPDGAAGLEAAGAAATGGEPGFAELAVAARRSVLATLFPGQLAALARRAADAVEAGQPGSDLGAEDVAAALTELTARLGVYRTYLGTGPVSGADRRRVGRAADAARPCLDAEGRRALGCLVAGLLGTGAPEEAPGTSGWNGVARRWQQLTGAVAAKSVEDTALYRFDGLVATAEVGGDPADPAVDPDRFHRSMAERGRRWPGSLNATTTHDTKRSEDVRARLAVLSEVGAQWEAQCARWTRRHRALRSAAERRDDAPDAHDERLLLQTLLGAWPYGGPDRDFTGRMRDYMAKAAREAKRRTSWLEPDERYERALASFVGRVLSPSNRHFGAEMDRWVARVGPAGAANSLTLVALKATAPGVPDVYQGTELWTPTLVDPDNRRPVDFAERHRLLASLDGQPDRRRRAAELLASWTDGRVKLLVTAELLRLRRERPTLFAAGSYLPLTVRGPGRRHVVAFARRRGAEWAVTIVPRLVYRLAGPRRFPVGAAVWGTTTVVLPSAAPSQLADVLSGAPVPVAGRSLPLAQVLGTLPVAVLRDDDAAH